MREAAINRRRVRDDSLSLTEDIEIKSLSQLPPHLMVSGEIMAPGKHFIGKRSPGKLVGAEFFYEGEEDEDFSGSDLEWNE